MRKKLKCTKCELWFRDREDEKDVGVDKELCFNCRFIWQVLGMTLQSLPSKINRDVRLRLEDVHIRRKKKV